MARPLSSPALMILGLVMTLLPAGSAAGEITVRVSVSSDGGEGEGAANLPAIAAEGRFISFRSAAENLVDGDTNGMRDIFVHDRATGETQLVSIGLAGQPADGHSGASAISGDGRFIAFASTATNLVPDDVNGANDVFLHDREAGETMRISAAPDGSGGNGASHTPAISADGRYIAFESAATNLVPGVGNSVWDIYVHDRITGETARASVSSSGSESNGDSRWAALSADGRYVAFTSAATTLVPGTPLFTTQVYVHDRQTGETMRVSVSSDGEPADDVCSQSSISADGRFVAFSSLAGNLSPDDQTASEDVFVHDRQTGETVLASVSSGGDQADASSFRAVISGDGCCVAFVSDAANLVAGDANGVRDVFRRNLNAGVTQRMSVSSRGGEGDAISGLFSGPSMTHDGAHIVFESHAANLVDDDANGVSDIFVRGPAWRAEVPGDLDDDGAVGVSDLLILLGAWGDCADANDCPADLDGDETVAVGDLLQLLAAWNG